MDLDLPVKPSARTALERLIDYAGLFPPAQLAMAPALAEFAGIRSGPHAWMVGRFVVPASRVPELRRALGSRPAPALSVVLDVSRDPYRWFDEARTALASLANLRAHRDPIARVDALEIPLPSLLSQRETYDAAISQLGAMLSQAKLRDLPVVRRNAADRALERSRSGRVRGGDSRALVAQGSLRRRDRRRISVA